MINSLLFALQFLTIIPVRIRQVDEKKIAQATVFFPLVGLSLGLILAGINNLLLVFKFESFLMNTILVVSLVILTGGLHLDGLADTFDALLSRKNKEQMLEIMRDSHIGAMGVLSLISVILLKIGLLSSMTAPSKAISLLIMCMLSRWSLVVSMFLFPYARKEGKAKVFTYGMNLKLFILSSIVTLCCVYAFLQLKGLLIILVAAICTYSMGKYIKNKIGGITGDTLGATNELIEIVILFTIVILRRMGL